MTSKAEVVAAVVEAFSVYGTKLSPYRLWSLSDTTPQGQASPTLNTHQRMSEPRRALRLRVRRKRTGNGRTAMVDVALTAPMAATAIPERAAARRVDPATAPPMRG